MMAIYVFDPTLALLEENIADANKVAHAIRDCDIDLKDTKKLLSFFKKIQLDEFTFLNIGKIERNRVIRKYS